MTIKWAAVFWTIECGLGARRTSSPPRSLCAQRSRLKFLTCQVLSFHLDFLHHFMPMLELFVIQSEFSSPKGQPNEATTYMTCQALETSHLRSILRNGFCRRELWEGKWATGGPQNKGKPCVMWPGWPGAHGFWKVRSLHCRSKASSVDSKFSVLAATHFCLQG